MDELTGSRHDLFTVSGIRDFFAPNGDGGLTQR